MIFKFAFFDISEMWEMLKSKFDILKWEESWVKLKRSKKIKDAHMVVRGANDHLIEFHLIEIVIFHLIESFN
jgi:hypothetical protein